MIVFSHNNKSSGNNLLCDMMFFLFIAFFAWLAMQGILPVSGAGVVLDSDLQTYAQGMAGENNPELFSADPVLHKATPANSIKNIERVIGGKLALHNNWGIGLLRAGALAIFVFYCGWYILGRWLYGSPALAATLAILCGVTVWIGWGTFWGITHSDPVPRVFFAALMPFLLLLAFLAVKKAILRPLAMLCAGLAIWAHGVSALNCGAMFFMAFMLIKPHDFNIREHIFNLFLCLIAFFIPVLIFLWPSLSQNRNFTNDELAVFKELFDLRWKEDYAGFAKRLKNFLSPQSQVFPLLLGGLAGWLVVIFRGTPREKIVAKMWPPFIAALAIVTCFCWAESHFAAKFGRLSMGHELVRGLRFIVPLAWIMIVGGVGCITGKILRRAILIVCLCLVLFFTIDRQYAAVQYTISQMTGINLPLSSHAEMQKQDADKYKQLMDDLAKIVPPGEPVFSMEDDMAMRYYALRPLVHTFKDGYVHYYNKDFENSKKWLEYEKLIRSGPSGYLQAWQKSGAPWLLCKTPQDKTRLLTYGSIVLDKNGWLLLHKN